MDFPSTHDWTRSSTNGMQPRSISHIFFLDPTFAVLAAGSNDINVNTTVSIIPSLNGQVTCYNDTMDIWRAIIRRCASAVYFLLNA